MCLHSRWLRFCLPGPSCMWTCDRGLVLFSTNSDLHVLIQSEVAPLDVPSYWGVSDSPERSDSPMYRFPSAVKHALHTVLFVVSSFGVRLGGPTSPKSFTGFLPTENSLWCKYCFTPIGCIVYCPLVLESFFDRLHALSSCFYVEKLLHVRPLSQEFPETVFKFYFTVCGTGSPFHISWMLLYSITNNLTIKSDEILSLQCPLKVLWLASRREYPPFRDCKVTPLV